MENTVQESCQTCFLPTLLPGEKQQTQWISVCRCDHQYSPTAQFSIDVCATCKRRVPANSSRRNMCPDICYCEKPNAQKIPAHLQNETDAVTLNLATVGMEEVNFPGHRYTPIALLGKSARSTTILARDKQRGIKVAVKIFKRINPNMHSTFLSEIKKNQQLTHTSIAKILDSGIQNDKSPYLVTEYKDGFNLEQCLALYGVPSPDAAFNVLLGICESLNYGQKQGVFHRDLRPANVIFYDDMNSEPSIFTTDFALPKIKANESLTEIEDAINITADEARNLEYNEKSEVYALGCIGYSLITGRPPFRDGSVQEIKNAHALKLPPQISSIKFDKKRPKEFDEIIERCMEKDPSVRFESIEKLVERLEVFPRRRKMLIDAVLAAKKRQRMIKIAGIAAAIAAVCAILGLVLSHH